MQHVLLLPQKLKSHCVICIINWLISWVRKLNSVSFSLSNLLPPFFCCCPTLSPLFSLSTRPGGLQLCANPLESCHCCLCSCLTNGRWSHVLPEARKSESERKAERMGEREKPVRYCYHWQSEHTSWVADSEQIKTRLYSFIFENGSSVSFHHSISLRRESDWHKGGSVLFNCCSDMTHAREMGDVKLLYATYI